MVKVSQPDQDQSAELEIRLSVWVAKISGNTNFDWPSIQFDLTLARFWVAILEKCTENGQWPAVISSSESGFIGYEFLNFLTLYIWMTTTVVIYYQKLLFKGIAKFNSCSLTRLILRMCLIGFICSWF